MPPPLAAAGGEAPPGQASGKALDQIGQHQAMSWARVKRLEHGVTRQPSDSDEATKRLQQRDKAIDELKKQLQKLKARPSVEQH